MENLTTGTLTGTGANIDVDLGWTPDFVEVINISDTTNFPQLSWQVGMGSGFAIKRSLSTFSRITTLGITPLGGVPGSSDTKRGFRVGADAAVNVNTNTLLYRAQRNADPKRS